MKKLSFLTLLLSIYCFTVSAQVWQCTPDTTFVDPGLYPKSDSLDCIIQGQNIDVSIYFKNFTTISGLTITTLKIDSITNLPCGARYAVNDPDRTYGTGESGCVQVVGLTNDAVGQYKLGIYVTLDIVGIGVVQGEAGALAAQFSAPDFSYYVRVKASQAAPCPAIDTTNAGGITASCVNVDYTVVKEIQSISQLTVMPNPFTSSAVITFNSALSGSYKAILTDVVGKEVETTDLDIFTGSNRINLDRKNLSSGMYFYTITNGNESITKRLVIQD